MTTVALSLNQKAGLGLMVIFALAISQSFTFGIVNQIIDIILVSIGGLYAFVFYINKLYWHAFLFGVITSLNSFTIIF